MIDFNFARINQITASFKDAINQGADAVEALHAAHGIVLEERTPQPKTLEEAFELLKKHNLLVAPNGSPLNEKQSLFVAYVICGRSCNLIGAAGTGKTTAVQASIIALLRLRLYQTIPDGSMKHISGKDIPAIIACAFTNRAAANIATKLPPELKENSLTHHKICEYVPVDKSKVGERGRFVPSRGRGKPLPPIDVLYYEEASMMARSLYEIQQEAYNPEMMPTEIILGDLYQIPPIFERSVLADKLVELPVIELTEVYRQAMDSPIIRLAHAIKDGKAIPPHKRLEYAVPGELDIKFFPDSRVEPFDLGRMLGKTIFKACLAGDFDPSQDTVLVPNNENLGQSTINAEFNACCDAQWPEPEFDTDPYDYEELMRIAPIFWSDFPEQMERVETRKFRGFRPWKIVAGFKTHYISSGDRVIYKNREGVVLEVIPNSLYRGFKAIGRYNRWGKALDRLDTDREDMPGLLFENDGSESSAGLPDLSLEDVLASKEKTENQASHKLVIQLDDGSIVEAQTRGDMNELLGGVAMTVHKSQGLEFRHVYLILHRSARGLLANEIVYTGITRAKQRLTIMCEPDSLSKAAKNRMIEGDTLDEKIKWIQAQLKRKQ